MVPGAGSRETGPPVQSAEEFRTHCRGGRCYNGERCEPGLALGATQMENVGAEELAMKLHSKQLRFVSIVLGAVVVILGSSAVAAVLPQPDHTMIIMLENQTYSGIIGSSNAPYINSLLPHAANFTNMHAITHPSQPNYIHFFSGESNGCIDNGPITPYADPPTGIPYQPLTTPNLGAQLLAAGKTFTAFAQGLPSVGWDKYTIASAAGTYYRDENPQANWMTVTFSRPSTGWAMMAISAANTGLPTARWPVFPG